MKFHIGNKVRIVKYGHLIWISNGPSMDYFRPAWPPYQVGEDWNVYDIAKEKIGTEDIVKGYYSNNGPIRYSLEHSAWYNEEQLEMVEKNNVFKDEV